MINFPQGKPDKVIETILSRIYFFGDTVYKVYKKVNHVPSDFTNPEFRKQFYDADFAWNHTMSPAMYTELGEFVDAEGSTDLCIVMKKADKPSLHELLLVEAVNETDLRVVAREMMTRIKALTVTRRGSMPDLFAKPYVDLDKMNLEYIRDWLYLSEKLISKSEVDAYIDLLKNFVSTEAYFKNFNVNDYVTSIDSHTENILYRDGEVDFIDSMPPVRDWRVQNMLYVLSRTVADVVVLGKGDITTSTVIYDEYEKAYSTKVQPHIVAYLQTVAAFIQITYFTLRGNEEFAKLFFNFAKNRIRDIGPINIA